MLDRRQRTGYLVLAVVVGHVILISAHVNARPGASVLENLTFGVFAEVQRLATSVGNGVVGVWTGYVGLRGLRSENEVLARDVAALQLQLQEQRAMAQRADRLEQLLEFRQHLALPTMSARVIAADATPYFLTLTVDRGTEDGIRSDLAVLAPTGVVGRVVGQPAARAARVQLLIDRNAAAGALIERTRASGVVMGEDDETSLRMEYVSNLETVWVGDRIVTSGIDGIYPKGFAIGTVTDIAPGVGLYQTIQIAPAVDFSQLEDVLVVMNDEAFRPREAESE
ncbi:MAG: rod shape-determining protein MreC [Vicinamibacterales bacterium]